MVKIDCSALLFNRASRFSLLDPKFKNDRLEEKFASHVLPLRVELCKLLLIYCILKGIIFGLIFTIVYQDSLRHIQGGLNFGLAIYSIGCIMYISTKSPYVRQEKCSNLIDRYDLQIIWCGVAIILGIISLSSRSLVRPGQPVHDQFFVAISIVEFYSIAYTLCRIRLPIVILLCICVPVTFEVLRIHFVGDDGLPAELNADNTYLLTRNSSTVFVARSRIFNRYIVALCLLHVSLNVVGYILALSSHSLTRSAFWSLGQMLYIAECVMDESRVIHKMIDSIMPSKISEKVINDIDQFRDSLGGPGTSIPPGGIRGESRRSIESSAKEAGSTSPRMSVKSKKSMEATYRFDDNGSRKSSGMSLGSSPKLFRPFVVSRMSNVSILFADIVGFTHMSSNKTASSLVGLLGDLYGRFDHLCESVGCEKIATLGDCYYCVSGCPDPRPDHADCCVEMGLGMMELIDEFDMEHNEEVKMRVGVHTGSVNCGIIGIHKFKFDIFSNDVTLANKMESSGKPGYVHITEATKQMLIKKYELIEAENFEFHGTVHQTFLIHQRDKPAPANYRYRSTSIDVVNELIITDAQINDVPVMEEHLVMTDEECPPALIFDIIKHRRLTSISLEKHVLDMAGHIHKARLTQNLDLAVCDVLYESPYHSAMTKLNRFSLYFNDAGMEKKYRLLYSKAKHSVDVDTGLQQHNVASLVSLSNPRINLLICMITSTVYSSLLSTAILLTSTKSFSKTEVVLQTSLTVIEWFLIAVTVFAVVCDKTKFSLFVIRVQASYLSFYFLVTPVIHFLTTFRLHSLPPGVLHLASLSLLPHLCLFPFNLAHAKCLIAIATTAIAVWRCIYYKWTVVPPAYGIDSVIATFLLFGLIVSIIRQKELVLRLMYFTEQEGLRQQTQVQREKDCADWILRNIIPVFVTEPLLTNHKYAKDYQCVGVAFITLTNYLSDLYEEQFEGGQFYGRVLNEFFADIDNLIRDPKFDGNLEKIKTIGPTYMVASGLARTDDESENTDHMPHLLALMEFLKRFYQLAESFSENLFNFDFIVRAGYNFGPVTAGVIGTHRLSYDIWGDAVNVASRMDSKGVNGRIQVPNHVVDKIGDHYQFESRGSVFIKGKDMMDVSLLVTDG